MLWVDSYRDSRLRLEPFLSELRDILLDWGKSSLSDIDPKRIEQVSTNNAMNPYFS